MRLRLSILFLVFVAGCGGIEDKDLDDLDYFGDGIEECLDEARETYLLAQDTTPIKLLIARKNFRLDSFLADMTAKRGHVRLLTETVTMFKCNESKKLIERESSREITIHNNVGKVVFGGTLLCRANNAKGMELLPEHRGLCE